MIEYFKAVWAMWQADEAVLAARIKAQKPGPNYTTSIDSDMLFYVGSGCVVVLGGYAFLVSLAFVVAGINVAVGLALSLLGV